MMPTGAGRANQKARTRKAIVDAGRELARAGVEITMPLVARRAMVAEATAYRYFPDLGSLLRATVAALWPPAAEILNPVADSTDPAERIAFAAEYLMRGIHTHQAAVRALIAHTITAYDRPSMSLDVIDHALAPRAHQLTEAGLAHLRHALATVIAPEALFTLTDACGLSIDGAITTTVHTATTITRTAFARPT